MSRVRKHILVILVFVLALGPLLAPTPVEARGVLRGLIRFVGRTTTFIVTTPGKIADRLTRPLGPVLGPIASDILLANAPNSIARIITKATKVKNVTDAIRQQEKKLNAARKVLRERAAEVRAEAQQLQATKAELERQLLSGDLTYERYKEEFASFQQILNAYEDTANRLERSADNLKLDHLLRGVARDALRRSVGNIGRVVQTRLSDELTRLLDPHNVLTFIGNDGLNVQRVIDLIVSGDVSRLLRDQGYGDRPDFDALVERLRDDIKQQMKNDRDFLKENWRDLLDQKVRDLMAQYNSEADALTNTSVNASTPDATNATADDSADNTVDDPSQIPLDEDGCPPGYEWERVVGKCRQAACNDVDNAHWSYTSDCICGSSGSIAENPEDPNKECGTLPTYAPCPNCIYACVGLDDECPDPPE